MPEEVVTEVESKEVVAAPESTPDVPRETQGTEVTDKDGAVAEAPSYVPNYKFKVNNEEKEFDEFVRGGIKDKDTEEKVRKLYADAYGLEYVKPKYEMTQKELKEWQGKYGSLESGVKEILGLRDKDFGQFLERTGASKEMVAKWMLEELKRQELPPEQKQWYDQLRETRRQNELLQKQLQQNESAVQEQSVQARTVELDSTLQRPEISAYAEAYDSYRKKPGAFREMIIRHGIAEWNVNQRDVPAEQAVQEVMSILGETYRGNAIPQAQAQVADDKPLPVIPNIKTGGSSPMGKQIKSIDDLRKRAAELRG